MPPKLVIRSNSGDRAAAIIIPAGTSAAVEQGKSADITVVKSPSSQDYRSLVVQSIVENVAQNFTAANIAANVAVTAVQSSGATANPTAVAQQARQQAAQQLSQQPLLGVTTETATQHVNDSSYNQVVPGYALMFAMFAVAGGVGSILEEKEAGVWKRLLISPISRWSLLGGKLLAQFVIARGADQSALHRRQVAVRYHPGFDSWRSADHHHHRAGDHRLQHAAGLGRQDPARSCSRSPPSRC